MTSKISKSGEEDRPRYRAQFFVPVNKDSVTTQLPDIKLVREEAAYAPELREAKKLNRAPQTLLADRITGEILSDPIPDSLYFGISLQKLFKWSHIVHTDDVPEELLEECIWALGQFIAEALESSDAQLRAIGMISTDQKLPPGEEERKEAIDIIKHVQLMQARIKLANHLIKPAINRPKDAALQLGQAMQSAKYVRRARPGEVAPFQERMFFVHMADMLFRAHENDTARLAVEHALPVADATGRGLQELIDVKAAVAKVYRSHGMMEDARLHEKWLVQWFRKNPHMIKEESLREILLDAGKPSVVLEELGGMDWFENRKHTDRTELRRAKQCRQCGGREPLVKLSICSGCQKIWYCSRECHKKDWPTHKVFCKDEAAVKSYIARSAALDPKAAQRQKDFQVWNELKDLAPYVHALGLHRDPKRARTHMIFQEAVHTPKHSDLSEGKFFITRCGVFKMDEAYRELERLMGLNRGEGKEYVNSLFDEANTVPRQGVPCSIAVFTMGKGVMGWLGEVPIPRTYLTDNPYTEEWRHLLNSNKIPPAQFVLANGKVQDREHSF